MLIILSLALYIIGVVNFVCAVMVLIKMFQESVLQGIIGFLCFIWAFIWGWQHKYDGYLAKVMPIWTMCLLAEIILEMVIVFMASHH